MSKVVVFDHPLIQHKLSIMRDKNTGTKEFRELLSEIAMLMVFEVTRDLETKEVDVETPITTCKCRVLSGKKLGIVPILRAGLGMVDGVINLVLLQGSDISVCIAIRTHLRPLNTTANFRRTAKTVNC